MIDIDVAYHVGTGGITGIVHPLIPCGIILKDRDIPDSLDGTILYIVRRNIADPLDGAIPHISVHAVRDIAYSLNRHTHRLFRFLPLGR